MTRRTRSAGFTLIEVLATIVLMGIVLPVAMRGLSIALNESSKARHTAEAAALAEAKLGELTLPGLATLSSASGDFGPEFPEYRWTCQTTASAEYGVDEVTVTVYWTARGEERSFSLTTLVRSGLSSFGGF